MTNEIVPHFAVAYHTVSKIGVLWTFAQ